MYLKELEVCGFKSFTNKTKIQFSQGISCIVGPNGSGKSNVADAIRWVLGEQSAKNLRGSKMEDVIFAGSKNRKPLGFAEVTITFDNSDGTIPLDYQEVAVTRKTYRTGESEYLLNGKSCRLKDIINCFADTGIGADGLSIIGQGQVSEIVSAKPEDRRGIIEEAAGIVKYRNRKREAVRKLTDTERSLERIGDIVFDLEGRLEPLRQQSSDAEKFLQLEAEKKQCEITLSAMVMQDLQQELKEVEGAFVSEQQKLWGEEAALAKSESALAELRLATQESSEKVSGLQQQLFNNKNEKERQQSLITVAQSKIQVLKENIIRLEKEIAELDKAQADNGEKIASLTENKKQIEEKVTEIKADLARGEGTQAAGEDDIALEQEKIQCIQQEQEALQEKIQGLRQQLALLDQSIQNKQAQIEKNTQLQLENKQQQEVFYGQLEEIGTNLQHNRQKMAVLKEENRKINVTLSDFITRLQQAGEEETTVRFQINSLQARVNMLKDMEESFDGYYPGVKAAILGKKQGQADCRGVMGVVADLLSVPTAYSVAIETALGGSLQNIVVETEQQAKAVIGYLKQKNAGRATLLPLDALQVRSQSAISSCVNAPGVIGRAVDLVAYPQEIRVAAEYLLSNILVAEDLNAATSVARQGKYSFRVVTLEGDIVNAGGSLTGGSRQKKTGDLLGRKNALAAAEAELREKLAEHQTYKEKYEALKVEREQLEEENKANSSKIHELELAQLALEKDEQQAEHLLQEAKKAYTTYGEEAEELAGQIEDVELDKKEIAAEQGVLAQQGEEISARMAAEEQLLQQLRDSFARAQQGLTETKIHYAKIQQELVGIDKEISRLDEAQQAILEQREEKQWDISIWSAEIENHEKDRVTAEETILALSQKIAAAEKDIEEIRHNLGADADTMEQLETDIQKLRPLVNALRQTVHEKEVQKARLETDWENEAAKLWEKYEINFAQACLAMVEGATVKEVKKRVISLQTAIAALGTINLGAIEEYRESKERYEFLTEQQQDLKEAKTSLEKVIKEMDAIMVKRFAETFHQVSKEFDHTFRHLFGGGSASLILTDAEDMLYTGVDISVQLPGKKISNYNLLSGGEKTIIGVALMLALLKVKPSPFCLLDEIDAALDEVNVSRFANYLADFAASTQFLLISHRQGTMEVADSLWGVTMAEEGVSKLISVSLQDVEKIS
ncbi:MAG: chromosome segregation protein SMC [Peptococcaceae bacterium]|nr:chromosome segregation protein SMC [Peptococcaceae bacterium]